MCGTNMQSSVDNIMQLACFIITVYVGQLLVHFVPCCPVQLPYVKRSCRCDYLFEQINDMIWYDSAETTVKVVSKYTSVADHNISRCLLDAFSRHAISPRVFLRHAIWSVIFMSCNSRSCMFSAPNDVFLWQLYLLKIAYPSVLRHGVGSVSYTHLTLPTNREV